MEVYAGVDRAHRFAKRVLDIDDIAVRALIGRLPETTAAAKTHALELG